MNESSALRLDRWLCVARFFRHREAVAKLVEARRLRVNERVITKTHQLVRPGDVLTFPQGPQLRVVRVVAIDEKRGPAMIARGLYDDLEPAG